MPAYADELLDRWLGGHPLLAKWVRYSTASVAGVVTSQVTLVVCLVALDMGAVVSNVIAVTTGAVPNYLINRAWTFNKRGTHSFTREVLPFWMMAFLGLVISTIAVAWVAGIHGDNVVAVSLTNIASFGTIWVAKYFVLDKVLFAPLAHALEEHELS